MRTNRFHDTLGCVALLALLLGAGPMVRAEEDITIIAALVDGPSQFIVTTNGFHWKNGINAKPGRHEGQNEPTYINATPWIPKWNNPDERGPGESDEYPWQGKPARMTFELLAVGDSPEVDSIEPRTPPTVSRTDGTLVINIPDPESGSKWYVFALVGPKLKERK